MVRGSVCRLEFQGKAAKALKRTTGLDLKQERAGPATVPWEAKGLNLPENCGLQQAAGDSGRLAGSRFSGTVQARSCLPMLKRGRCWGLTEGEWVARPVEDVLWGLFPGTAEPQTLLNGTRRAARSTPPCRRRDGKLLPVEGTYSILERGAARGRDRGPSRRTRTGAEVAADGRRAGQHSRSGGHRTRQPRSLHQSGVYEHVRLHRRRSQRRQPARTDCAGDAAERACDAGKGRGRAGTRDRGDGAREQARAIWWM